MSVGIPGLVDEASCSREETVLVVWGFVLDRPQPFAWGDHFEKFTKVYIAGKNEQSI